MSVFDDFIQGLNMSKLDEEITCATIHPKVVAILDSLDENSPDGANVFSALLSEVESQVRECLANEIMDFLVDEFGTTKAQAPTAMSKKEMHDVVHMVITLAYIVRTKLESE